MNKPAGLSRIARRDIVAIVREYLNDPSAYVDFDEDCAYGARVERHDEGWSRLVVQVYFPEGAARTYSYEAWQMSRDCDGRYSWDQRGTVRPSPRRRRHYLYRDRYRGTLGPFTPGGRYSFRIEGKEGFRDHTAEAAGY